MTLHISCFGFFSYVRLPLKLTLNVLCFLKTAAVVSSLLLRNVLDCVLLLYIRSLLTVPPKTVPRSFFFHQNWSSRIIFWLYGLKMCMLIIVEGGAALWRIRLPCGGWGCVLQMRCSSWLLETVWRGKESGLG